MNIVGIIPARMGSSRFPGKPLANIHGIPMIGHVYFRSKMAKILDDVYVATCDQEIIDYIKSIDGKAIMTDTSHERASDRTSEALNIIESRTEQKTDIIVMLQGDEPMILPEMIDAAVQPLLDDQSVTVSNLMATIKKIEEWEDPNEVKVVVDKENFAIYFSREPIPSKRKYSSEIKAYKQVCVIPFTRDCLINYTRLEPTPLEIIESVDMNRFIENGIKIKMIETDNNTIAVDTPQDLANVERLMKNDSLIRTYLN
ncbi:3-deoxy-manno-octulosonate cytidylyltransferase [Candidatus Woesearchaeota archaeon]|nr:3-deoxy-manno-octulosonate cytidylyltransferase [Candidatus Woesearchaeota archaeon]